MTFQYGDLRVDEITYTSGGVNQTVSVSGLVADINGAGGGTFDGNVTITGDLIVTGNSAQISTNTITGNSANFTTITGQTGSFQTISGDFINKYNSGVITQLSGSAIGYTTITGQTVTGIDANFVKVSGTTVTGDTIRGTSGVFVNLSGQTITGDTVNVKSGVFSFITGADAHFGKLSANDIVFPGDETVNNFTVTGTLTANSIVATGISATVITGTTVTGSHAEFTSGTFQNITVTNTISGATVTGTNADFTTGTFQTIDGPIASSTATGVTRIATTAEAVTAAGPSGTYADAITAPASAAINPSNLREALQAYDPLGPTVPAAFPAETGVYGREVITTGTFGVDGGVQIASITWKTISGLEDVGEPVTVAEAISAVGPSGTYDFTVSGDVNSQTFYNPATLRDTFKAYDPFPTGVGSTIFARTVEGVLDGGQLVATGYEWIKIPTGTPALATDNQAGAAAGASGTYSDTPIGGSVFINPESLRSAFKNYDPQPPAGVTRIYARSVSGLTATTTTGENWIDIGDVLQGDFLPTTGGTVSGDVTITGQLTVGEQLVVQSQGLIVTGDVRHSGNTSMSGNLDVNGHINAQFNSAVNNVLYQVNGSAQRGIFQGPNAGVAVAKGGRQIVEFTSTGTGPAVDFALLSGDLRVGNNNQAIGNLNTSQFWAFERGNFASASDEESEIWRNRVDDVKILTIKSSVGGNRSEVFGIGTSGQIFLSGSAGTSGQFIMSNGAGKGATYSAIQATPGGDLIVHDLTVTGNASFASGMTVTGQILGAAGATITGFSEIAATTGEFEELDVLDENNGLIRSFSGDFHSLVIGRPDIYGPFLDSPHLIVQGSGIFESGVFFTDDADVNAMAIYGPSSNTAGPNIVIGRPGVLGGITTRNSIAIGDNAQENASSDSDRNIAIGNNALEDMTDGHQNIAIGHAAAQNIRPGNNQGANTVIGDQALFGNTAANNNSRANVVVGRAAMFDALQANNNVAIGTQAGFNLVTVTGNVLIGESVNLNGTTGDDNVFIGNQAALNNTASGNIAIGSQAAQSLTDGNNNTIIGSIAGAAGMSDTIILGAGATQKVTVSGDDLTFSPTNGNDAIIRTSGLTADRTYLLPDQNGTFAMLSDIPGGDSSLDVNNISVLNDDDVQVARISGDDGGSAMFASGQFTIADNGNTQISGNLNVSGQVTFTQAASGIFTFSGDNSTTNVAIGTGNAGTSNLAIVCPRDAGEFASFTIGQNVDGSNEDHLGIYYGQGGTPQADIFTATGNMNFSVDGAGGQGDIFTFGRALGADTFVEISSGNVTISGGAGANAAAEISLGENLANGGETFTIKSPESLASGLTLIMPDSSPTAANRFLRAAGAAVSNTQTLEWASSPGGGISGVTIQDEGTQQGNADEVTTFNFVGAGVTAAVAGDTTTITIPGGGGGASGVVGASAWVTFNGTSAIGTDCTVSGNLNVDRVEHTAAGSYVLHFGTNMPNDDYSTQVTSSNNSAGVTAQAVGTVSIFSSDSTGNLADATRVNAAVFATNSTLARGTAGTDGWGFFNGQDNVADADRVLGSFNVSGVARTAQGTYTVTLQNAMPNEFYAVNATANTNETVVNAGGKTTTEFVIVTLDTDGNATDCGRCNFAVNATNANLPATITQEQLDALFDGRAFNGIAAWGNVPIGNNQIVPNGALNVGSVEKTATGQYTITFDTPMPNANYAINATCENAASLNALVRAQRADGFDLNTYNTNDNSNTDSQFFFQVVSLNAAPPRGGTGTDAWAAVAANGDLLGSFNIARIDKVDAVGDGVYDVFFAQDMPNTNYSVVATSTVFNTLVNNKNVGDFRVQTFDSAGNGVDAAFSCQVNATNAVLPETITDDQIAALIQNPVLSAWGFIDCQTGGQNQGTVYNQLGSFNIESVTKGAQAGNYIVRFEEPLANANYSVVASVSAQDSTVQTNTVANTASGFTLQVLNQGGNPANTNRLNFQVAGTARNGTLGGGADAWGNVAGDGTLEGGFNCTITKNAGNGSYTVNFINNLPNANYSVTTGAANSNSSPIRITAKAVGSFQVDTATNAQVATDLPFNFAVFATDGNAGGFIVSSGIQGTANQVLTPLNPLATFSVGNDAVNLLPSGTAQIYNATATNDAVCLRINSDVLGANRTAAEIHADGSAHFQSPTNANVAVEAKHTGNAGSTALAVTDAGNNQVIQLDNDGGIVASGNIQASGLTDGVTTRTMTEVLANNSGPGSVLQMRQATLTPIAGAVSSTAFVNIQTAAFNFTPVSATSTIIVDFIIECRQNNVAATNIQVNLRATCAGSGSAVYRYSSFSAAGGDGMVAPVPVRGIFLAGTTTQKAIMAQAQMNQNAGNATFNGAMNVVVTEIAN